MSGHQCYFGFFHDGGSSATRYEVRLIPDDREIQLWFRYSSGSTRIDTKSCTFRTGEWMTCEIETTASATNVTFGGTTITSSHSQQPGRGIFFFSGGDRFYWDEVRAI